MVKLDSYAAKIENDGFVMIPYVFTEQLVTQLLQVVDQADTSGKTFRKSADLFAIRQFLKELPGAIGLIFNTDFKALIQDLFGKDYFIVKSIYFDKPEQSNWFVSYHQDLTISVDKKVELEGYGMWTVKQNQFAVQPPLEILKKIYTIRIHLDDTNENNGALKVIPGSHLKDIYRSEDIDWSIESEVSCNVPRGGIMIMKPLLMHSSSRTTSNHKRRVIHIEFCNQELHSDLKWIERINL
ncbi:phytanoyl-CoA dioxygenase [Pedobacter sp. HMWF019]|uniref:phytanoyl-CoA dioxygenase family protein n=1 Tax=Pedobacter sp. HMWF019 TaxID=2056856 RepID=UPI000D36A64C|nr:phytanoyl-CoA dioxygenase family protein [Pedobacter sp. HMWF019]PTT01762.1 phytanoyl-CoA dioxygenase [Pedobacter sp. HMWF019]